MLKVNETESETPPDLMAGLDAEKMAPPALPLRAPAPVHRTVIEPPIGWQLINFRELWRYRELLFSFAWRDVKVRYKQTVLGAAWAVLQPAMMMVVFSIFFGRLAGVSTGGVPGPLFYLSGLLPWFFFSSALSSAANSVVGSQYVITKIYFPRLAVPFAAVGAAAVDFVVACGLLALVAIGYAIAVPGSVSLSWSLLLAPVVFAIMAVLAAGLGTLLAALNVAYRDFRYLIPFMIQIGMFATPTIYMQPSGNEGRSIAWLLWINPMTSLVSTFRSAAIGGSVPWAGLGLALVAALFAFMVGCLYFRKVEHCFADII
ncbi:MAG TPA: ABC transporter permease [Gemmataceae bacterium]|nr:ABC transporter permease [Gemmataceae bacterium]